MTTTEQDLRRRVEAGETHGQIAESLGLCRTHVASACAVLGIKRPRKAKPPRPLRPPVIPTAWTRPSCCGLWLGLRGLKKSLKLNSSSTKIVESQQS